MSKVYKIVNKNGLFRAGSVDTWSKKGGKIWNSIGTLKNALHNMATGRRDKKRYPDVMIIEYELIETNRYLVDELLDIGSTNKLKGII